MGKIQVPKNEVQASKFNKTCATERLHSRRFHLKCGARFLQSKGCNGTCAIKRGAIEYLHSTRCNQKSAIKKVQSQWDDQQCAIQKWLCRQQGQRRQRQGRKGQAGQVGPSRAGSACKEGGSGRENSSRHTRRIFLMAAQRHFACKSGLGALLVGSGGRTKGR